MAERAAGLLADPALAVKTVAARCGFADPSHFVRWFRRQRGTTPGAARGGA
jgi:AraC-like DNA-binding protein